MKSIIKVYDCDGVLLDSSARYKTRIDEQGREVIDLEFWRKMEHACYFDKPLPMAAQYQADLQNPDCYVIIATARQMRTCDFLSIEQLIGKPHAYIYRREGDTRGGALLKILGLRKIVFLKQFAHCSIEYFEDNAAYLKQVCDHFKGRILGHYVPSNQGH